jgi:hypothetical protein
MVLLKAIVVKARQQKEKRRLIYLSEVRIILISLNVEAISMKIGIFREKEGR